MTTTNPQRIQSPSTPAWREVIAAYHKQHEELSNDEFAVGKFKLQHRLSEKEFSFVETLHWVDAEQALKDLSEEQIQILYKYDKEWWGDLIECAASIARTDSIEQIKKESIEAYKNFSILIEAKSQYVCAIINAGARLRFSEQPVEGLCENAEIAWKEFLFSIGRQDAEKLYLEGLDQRREHRKMLDSVLTNHELKRE